MLLMLFSLTMAPPIFVSFLYKDQTFPAFVLAFAITFVTGLVAWFPVHKVKQDLRTKDGFLIVSLFWAVLAIFGSLPFLIADATQRISLRPVHHRRDCDY